MDTPLAKSIQSRFVIREVSVIAFLARSTTSGALFKTPAKERTGSRLLIVRTAFMVPVAAPAKGINPIRSKPRFNPVFPIAFQKDTSSSAKSAYALAAVPASPIPADKGEKPVMAATADARLNAAPAIRARSSPSNSVLTSPADAGLPFRRACKFCCCSAQRLRFASASRISSLSICPTMPEGAE